ncbi:MAG: gliding motility-associated C-terminal domain-containing protein [Flavobacteriales bacterium]|jgi:hypothetical protein|nr:gliding motility-associated C-terminal domain-containing protein [Flavobacteriales bacterium]MBP9176149.1 gliding motility-associated C-terminal domain-containing protein [Flavobacteriales bacterium]
MRDSVNDLFRERFQGHELPVDGMVWQGVQGQLGTSPTDSVNALFRERFKDHQVPVDPAVWSGISTQMGHTVAGVATGTMAWLGAGIAAVAIGIGVYYMNSSKAPAVTMVTENVISPRTEQQLPTAMPIPGGATLTQVQTSVEPEEFNISAAKATEPKSVKAKPATAQSDATEPKANKNTPVQQLHITTTPAVADESGEDLVQQIITEMTTQAVAAAHAEELAGKGAQEKELKQEEGVVLTPAVTETTLPVAATKAPLPKLYLQNVFTPNGDGNNDTYEIVGADAFEQVLFRVYSVNDNRLVFSTNMNEWWTGENCPDGYYLVAVEAIAPDGRLITEGKVVWLNRSPMN